MPAAKNGQRGRKSAVPAEDQKRLARDVIAKGKELGSREKAWSSIIADYRKKNPQAPKTFAAGQAWIERYFPDQVQRRRRRGSASAAGASGASRRGAASARKAARIVRSRGPRTRVSSDLASAIDYADVFRRLTERAKKDDALRSTLRDVLFESTGLGALVS